MSIWLDGQDYQKNIKVLDKDINVDVLIIGGGITGLTTLYQLRNSPLKVVLVDRNLTYHGVTSRSTAKINYLQECIYSDLTNKYNEKVAKKYYESQKDAIKEIRNIIKDNHIACDLEQVDSYIFAKNKNDRKKIINEKNLLTSFDCQVQSIDENTIGVSDTYVFHPLKYLAKIKDICIKAHQEIYEYTNVTEIKKEDNYYLCYANNHIIKAHKVILACHYPFFIKPYYFILKAHLEKSYIVVTKDKNKHITKISVGKDTDSLRYYHDNLLFLSNSSNICNNLNDVKNYQNTEKMVKGPVNSYFKNEDIITVDKLPYIGYIEKNNHNLLLGTGYNTWGMTNGTLAGLILSDLILNKENKYANLCNPLRVSYQDIFSILYNIYSSAKGYIQNKLKRDKWWYQNVTFKKINNKMIGIVKDNNKEYKVYNKCPHLGCSLVYNEVDKTWDCPCHASRFTISGKCLKGPSKKDVTFKD